MSGTPGGPSPIMVPYLLLRRAMTTLAVAALGGQGLVVQATEYDLLQLAKLPHSGASVAFVALCRRAALWLEEGLGVCQRQCPIAAPKSTLAVQTLRRVCAALKATSGSAISPPCTRNMHACAPKRPPALDGASAIA